MLTSFGGATWLLAATQTPGTTHVWRSRKSDRPRRRSAVSLTSDIPQGGCQLLLSGAMCDALDAKSSRIHHM
jgi:hypothetical protein